MDRKTNVSQKFAGFQLHSFLNINDLSNADILEKFSLAYVVFEVSQKPPFESSDARIKILPFNTSNEIFFRKVVVRAERELLLSIGSNLKWKAIGSSATCSRDLFFNNFAFEKEM